MGLLTDNGMYLRAMRDAFADLVSDYSNLRCYIADRYGEDNPRENVIAWMQEKHVVITEGVPEAERWEQQFWGGWHGLTALIRDEEDVADEITEIVYEHALEDEEPWALESHEHRKGST